jgi:4,5-DOPA dioxygenase extradiol
MFPEADVPVVQLSLDQRKPPALHYELGLDVDAVGQVGLIARGTWRNLRRAPAGLCRVSGRTWVPRFSSLPSRPVNSAHHADALALSSITE